MTARSDLGSTGSNQARRREPRIVTPRRSRWTRARTGVGLARAAAWRRPRVQLALKTAMAAVLAWLLVQPVGGFTDDYPYYAPLGAVVVMSTAVVDSVRSATRAVAAILLGAAIAFAAQALPEPAAIGVAVALGTAMAGWRWFGPLGGWIPFAALFVLIVGEGDPVRYAAAYGGLTAFGAAVGIAVNLLLPQLPLMPAALAQDQMRDDLADRLDQLADGLEAGHLLGRDDWDELRWALQPQARRVEELLAQAMEARRGNWRARRRSDLADRRYEHARALQRLARCVDEVITVVSDDRAELHATDPLAADLRAAIARAFRAVAAMLREVDGDHAHRGEEGVAAAEEARAAVADLRERAWRATVDSPRHDFTAASIALDLQRAVEAWD